MLNLLRMDLYRLFRSKAFYICLGIIAFTTLFTFGMMYIFTNPDMMQRAAEWGMDISQVYTDAKMQKAFSHTTLSDIFQQTNINGGMLLVITSILAVIFFCSEHSGGFIKNIMASHTNKWDYVLSKLLCLSIINFLYLASTYLLDVVLNALVGNYFQNNALPDTLLYLLTLWIVSNGFSALTILVCVCTRSLAASMVTAIVISSGLIVLILSPLLGLFHVNGILSYTMYFRFTTAPQHYLAPGDFVGMAVGVLFTILYTIASKMIISRQDF